MTLLDLPQDRDYTPYAYPGIFRTGYLTDGHVDIKPPLIHWAYKLWMNIFSIWPSVSLTKQLRSMPLTGAIVSVLCLIISGHIQAAVVLAFLFASPTLWTHMANTEWMTVTALCLILCVPTPIAWSLLGLLPWINQKNLLLILPLAYALHLPLSWACLFLLPPSIIILLYLSATDRIEIFYYWCVTVPATFARGRTLKRNTLSASRMLIPALCLIAIPIATMELDRWTLLLTAMILVTVISKQIVPHHFILFFFPIALGAHLSSMVCVAWLFVWIPRDGLCWRKPEWTYKFTFNSGGGDYGAFLADVKKIEAYLREHDGTLWVNGMENQIYLNAHKKAWRIEIPELVGFPSIGELPRYIVHCAASAKKFDYSAYNPEPLLISASGQFSLFERVS